MKYLALLAAAALVSCSSAQKQSQTTAPETKAAAAKADPAKAMAKKSASDSTDGEKLTCASGQDSRVLEIDKKEGGCTLNYTKAGDTKAVATAKSGSQYCEDSRDKIRGKLEKAGFACK